MAPETFWNVTAVLPDLLVETLIQLDCLFLCDCCEVSLWHYKSYVYLLLYGGIGQQRYPVSIVDVIASRSQPSQSAPQSNN
jgi:hypothetical protein